MQIIDFIKLTMMVCRCILYSKTQYSVICKNELVAKETYDKLIKIIGDNLNIIRKDDNFSILFENESNIQFLIPKKKDENLRGKRAKIIDWSDTYIDTKMIDEVLNEYSKLENEMEMNK